MLFYRLLHLVLLPLTLILLWWRKDTGKRWIAMAGLSRRNWPRSKNVTWIHAVSYGETVLALHFMRTGHEMGYLSGPVLFTTTIENALFRFQKDIAKFYPEPVESSFLPLDLPWNAGAFIKRIQPRAFYLMETDFWPGYLNCLQKNQIPCYLINGRISEGLKRLMDLFPGFYRQLLQGFRLIQVQSETDQKRLKPFTRSLISGNAKVDCIDKAELAFEDLRKWPRQFFVLGSIHEDEMPFLLPLLKAFAHEFHFVLAPRKTALCQRLPALLGAENCAFFSKNPRPSNYLIVDQMGLLNQLYQLSNLAFVGGSLNQAGGHNFLEPVACKNAVITGPNLRNFQDLADDFCQHKCLNIIKTSQELTDLVASYLKNPRPLMKQGLDAHQHLVSLQGVLHKSWKNLESLSA